MSYRKRPREKKVELYIISEKKQREMKLESNFELVSAHSNIGHFNFD